jgi:hypothetical protein
MANNFEQLIFGGLHEKHPDPVCTLWSTGESPDLLGDLSYEKRTPRKILNKQDVRDILKFVWFRVRSSGGPF